MSVILSVALLPPEAEGVNLTPTEQVLEGAIVAPVQESVALAKSAAFEPAIVAVAMIRLAVPELVTVSVWIGLAVFRN